jgi:hypothetical protein
MYQRWEPDPAAEAVAPYVDPRLLEMLDAAARDAAARDAAARDAAAHSGRGGWRGTELGPGPAHRTIRDDSSALGALRVGPPGRNDAPPGWQPPPDWLPDPPPALAVPAAIWGCGVQGGVRLVSVGEPDVVGPRAGPTGGNPRPLRCVLAKCFSGVG